jgi:hypothetical protein
VAYRGVATKQPIDSGSSPATLTGTVTGAQIAFVAPSISPSGARDRLAVFFVYDSGDGSTWGNASVAPTATAMTKLADTGSIALFDGALAGAGATGTVTASASFSASDSIYGTALVVALAPP